VNDRKVIMSLGWVWGTWVVPSYLVKIADACLSMHGPWWLFFGTAAVFAWWAYLLLTAFVAPCPFKMIEELQWRLSFRTLAHERLADVHVRYKSNGRFDARVDFKNNGTPGKLTEVWE